MLAGSSAQDRWADRRDAFVSPWFRRGQRGNRHGLSIHAAPPPTVNLLACVFRAPARARPSRGLCHQGHAARLHLDSCTWTPAPGQLPRPKSAQKNGPHAECSVIFLPPGSKGAADSCVCVRPFLHQLKRAYRVKKKRSVFAEECTFANHKKTLLINY